MATIVVKGTTIGTAAGADASYSINVPNAQSVLVVSFMGMGEQEIPVNGKSVIDVALVPDTTALDEVVVTAVSITKAKKSLAFSVGEVKSESLVQAGGINAIKSLDGKISGINLTTLSGDPRSSVLVNVCGTTTMSKAGDANVSKKGKLLYLMDGIAVGRQSLTSRDGVDFGNILSTFSNTVSINGNYDQGAFHLSFSNLKNTRVMPTTQTKQTSIALNSEYKFPKDVKV